LRNRRSCFSSLASMSSVISSVTPKNLIQRRGTESIVTRGGRRR
jgi:hypothetical protein